VKEQRLFFVKQGPRARIVTEDELANMEIRNPLCPELDLDVAIEIKPENAAKCWTGAMDPICAKCTEAKQRMSIGELETELIGLQVQLELCLTKVKKLKDGS
jgi:hypothetical protein